ncbi:MAG TPA: TonB-dependent siderophore receptor [Terriglobia bacterium]|nr:TonB-dependent siderophore receptor [Terriglobia bacterium]
MARKLLSIALIVGDCLCYAYSQTPAFAIQGRILDVTSSAIAGAQITIIPSSHASDASALSDQNGEFSLALLAGKYTIKVAAKGFEEISQTIDLQETVSQDFVLQVASVHEMVTVKESPGYEVSIVSSATKTLTPLLDIPQSINVVTQEQVRDQAMLSLGDVVRYVPGITAHQGENNRDQIIIRGTNSSADFFVNGVRDDVQYYRDLYNLERIEALKGPNALIFGRGGGGGVINRVTKEAGSTPLREMMLLGGSYGNKRLTADFDQPLTDNVAFRLNAMIEKSDSFRKYVNLKRSAVNPTLTFTPSTKTRVTLGYEHFSDRRVADRGIPSFQGRPADIDISTYFGNPDDSYVQARLNLGSASVEHQTGRLSIQDRVSFGDYDRSYQNFVPGSVNAEKTLAGISAYNNATRRRNAFNQTNLIYGGSTWGIRHTILAGAEIGRQLTDNVRNTGYFNNSTTSISVAYLNPTTQTPVTFRQSATDADNHLETNLAATYVQDQLEVSRHLQVIGGLRFDYFDLQYLNNRTNESLRRIDKLVSPRVGIVLKPAGLLSIYGTYSVSYLPSSGDQFSSLTSVTQQLKPEKFNNYELGMKWDIYRNLSLTTAVYRLDRTNTRSTDPNDPTRIIQTGRTRSNGYEAALNGRITGSWKITGGYAYQDAFIASTTINAAIGARVGQVPRHTFSLWNNYQIVPRLGAGLGIIHRSDMYAAIDNTVTLPSYTRVDAAVFFPLTENMRFQANVENIFDRKYYVNADSNTNISPGSPRAVRLGLTARF